MSSVSCINLENAAGIPIISTGFVSFKMKSEEKIPNTVIFPNKVILNNLGLLNIKQIWPNRKRNNSGLVKHFVLLLYANPDLGPGSFYHVFFSCICLC